MLYPVSMSHEKAERGTPPGAVEGSMIGTTVVCHCLGAPDDPMSTQVARSRYFHTSTSHSGPIFTLSGYPFTAVPLYLIVNT